ncbi:hypothetical protein Aph02nite_65850 [Actinoplanes philippinensis]|nr:hypothetical protein Aph02nite_65850 [Actinoplanes philippinensis]
MPHLPAGEAVAVDGSQRVDPGEDDHVTAGCDGDRPVPPRPGRRESAIAGRNLGVAALDEQIPPGQVAYPGFVGSGGIEGRGERGDEPGDGHAIP